LKDKITFSFYKDNRKLAMINFHFPDMKVSLINTKDFLYFYTVLQVFLQGQLEEERATLQLNSFKGLKDNGKVIDLLFDRKGEFIFRKVSENQRQYLLIEITEITAIAEKESQRVELYDFDFEKRYKDYLDKEFSLVTPEKPLRLRRFQAQYYFNILQKVSYAW